MAFACFCRNGLGLSGRIQIESFHQHSYKPVKEEEEREREYKKKKKRGRGLDSRLWREEAFKEKKGEGERIDSKPRGKYRGRLSPSFQGPYMMLSHFLNFLKSASS